MIVKITKRKFIIIVGEKPIIIEKKLNTARDKPIMIRR